MPPRYAENTEVPVDRSRQQVEKLLQSRKVQSFHYGWDETRDIIEFLWNGKQLRFTLDRPKRNQFKLHHRVRSESEIQRLMEKADRQRWRALYLVLRAKIEAVEANLSVFEEEFLAFFVIPGTNQTVGEILVPRLKEGHFDLSRALPPGTPRYSDTP